MISKKGFELEDPLGEHSARLKKCGSKYGDVMIHFDSYNVRVTTNPSKLFPWHHLVLSLKSFSR